MKADAAQRVFDLRTEGIVFAVIDGGIDATHPAFLNWSTTKADEYIADKSQIPLADLQARSRIAATYDLTLVRDIIASNGDPKMASPKVRPTIEKLAANKAQKTALEHMAVRNANARDLDWEIVLPLVRVPHDAGYVAPGTDHGTHVAGIMAAEWRQPSDLDVALIGMCPGLSLYDLRVFDADGQGRRIRHPLRP